VTDNLELRWFCGRMLALVTNDADVRMYQALLMLAPYLVDRDTPVPVVPVIPAPRQPHPAETALFQCPPVQRRRP
jgi:hypothetical protein